MCIAGYCLKYSFNGVSGKAFKEKEGIRTHVIEELGNPFADAETSTDLYTLDSKRIMPDSVVHTVRTAEDAGKAHHQTFVAEQLNSNIAAFNDTVHKNNLPVLTSKQG